MKLVLRATLCLRLDWRRPGPKPSAIVSWPFAPGPRKDGSAWIEAERIDLPEGVTVDAVTRAVDEHSRVIAEQGERVDRL